MTRLVGSISAQELMETVTDETLQMQKRDAASNYTKEQSTPIEYGVDWDGICLIEPELLKIEADARSAFQDLNEDKRIEAWYEKNGLRDRLSKVVGWVARYPALRTEYCYDLAYEHIYLILDPD